MLFSLSPCTFCFSLFSPSLSFPLFLSFHSLLLLPLFPSILSLLPPRSLQEMYSVLSQELKRLAEAHGERLLQTPHNPISLGKGLHSIQHHTRYPTVEVLNATNQTPSSVPFSWQVTGPHQVTPFFYVTLVQIKMATLFFCSVQPFFPPLISTFCVSVCLSVCVCVCPAAMSLDSLQAQGDKIVTELGSMLFTRQVSGAR